MRIAAGILALVIFVMAAFQGCATGVGSELGAEMDKGMPGGFMVVAMALLIGGAFSFGVPFVAGIIFLVGGLMSALASVGMEEAGDLSIYPYLMFFLAFLTLLDWYKGRKKKGDKTPPDQPNAE